MSYDVEFIGDSPEDMAQKLSILGSGAKSSVDDGLLKAAKEIKSEIEDEAPVDTGDFESSWYIEPVAEGEVWILSSSRKAPHNQYIMLPNTKFQGHPNADNPATGVYFDVVAIAQGHRKGIFSSVENAVMGDIGDI